LDKEEGYANLMYRIDPNLKSSLSMGVPCCPTCIRDVEGKEFLLTDNSRLYILRWVKTGSGKTGNVFQGEKGGRQ